MTTAGTQPAFDNEQTELLREILNQVKISNVKLYGNSDADKEGETGRLPKVEQDAKDAKSEIEKLKNKVVYASGIATGIGIVLSHLAEKLMK